jgi:hypothetical protein
LERAVDRLRAAMIAGKSLYHEALCDNYQNLAEILVLSGDHAAAAQAARNLLSISEKSPRLQYYAACFFARCVPLAEGDMKLAEADRRELTGKYADESIAALQDALRSGFDDVRQIHMDQDTLLKAVASRSDFQALLKQSPASPNK